MSQEDDADDDVIKSDHKTEDPVDDSKEQVESDNNKHEEKEDNYEKPNKTEKEDELNPHSYDKSDKHIVDEGRSSLTDNGANNDVTEQDKNDNNCIEKDEVQGDETDGNTNRKIQPHEEICDKLLAEINDWKADQTINVLDTGNTTVDSILKNGLDWREEMEHFDFTLDDESQKEIQDVMDKVKHQTLDEILDIAGDPDFT